jgi:hypothetical protein
MSTRAEFDIAFAVITEGERANIPDVLKRRLFGEHWPRRMRAIQARADEWINTREVQGLAVGRKREGGKPTDELAIVVYVDMKRARRKLRKPVPRRIRIPNLDTFETQIVAIGQVAPLEYPDHVRPAMPGSSIGHYDMETSGTFGLLVKKQPGQGGRATDLFILSNAHVLALDGLGVAGDNVMQPGPDDISGASGMIAKLTQSIPFNYATRGWPNLVDAAIARVVGSGNATKKIRNLGFVPVGVSSQITEGMIVQKVGKSSDTTCGEVLETHAVIKYPLMKTASTWRMVRFGDQVRCDRFAVPGDSGSIVLNEQKKVVGMVAWGGVDASSFNKIDHVFSALKITIA